MLWISRLSHVFPMVASLKACSFSSVRVPSVPKCSRSVPARPTRTLQATPTCLFAVMLAQYCPGQHSRSSFVFVLFELLCNVVHVIHLTYVSVSAVEGVSPRAPTPAAALYYHSPTSFSTSCFVSFVLLNLTVKNAQNTHTRTFRNVCRSSSASSRRKRATSANKRSARPSTAKTFSGP